MTDLQPATSVPCIWPEWRSRLCPGTTAALDGMCACIWPGGCHPWQQQQHARLVDLGKSYLGDTLRDLGHDPAMCACAFLARWQWDRVCKYPSKPYLSCCAHQQGANYWLAHCAAFAVNLTTTWLTG